MWESRRSQILGSFLFVFLFFPIFLSISSRSSLLNREREKIWKDREKEIRKTNNKKDTTRKRKKTRDVWARWLYDSLGSCQRSLSHVVFLVSCLSSLSWSVINLFLSSISFSSIFGFSSPLGIEEKDTKEIDDRSDVWFRFLILIIISLSA